MLITGHELGKGVLRCPLWCCDLTAVSHVLHISVSSQPRRLLDQLCMQGFAACGDWADRLECGSSGSGSRGKGEEVGDAGHDAGAHDAAHHAAACQLSRHHLWRTGGACHAWNIAHLLNLSWPEHGM